MCLRLIIYFNWMMSFFFHLLNISYISVTSYLPYTECLKQNIFSILTTVIEPHQVGLDAKLLSKIFET